MNGLKIVSNKKVRESGISMLWIVYLYNKNNEIVCNSIWEDNWSASMQLYELSKSDCFHGGFIRRKPLQSYRFTQDGYTFKQKLEIFKLANSEKRYDKIEIESLAEGDNNDNR